MVKTAIRFPLKRACRVDADAVENQVEADWRSPFFVDAFGRASGGVDTFRHVVAPQRDDDSPQQEPASAQRLELVGPPDEGAISVRRERPFAARTFDQISQHVRELRDLICKRMRCGVLGEQLERGRPIGEVGIASLACSIPRSGLILRATNSGKWSPTGEDKGEVDRRNERGTRRQGAESLVSAQSRAP